MKRTNTVPKVVDTEKEGYMKKNILELHGILSRPAIDYKNKKYDGLLDDLQANILKHHKLNYTEYHFIQFKNKVNACGFLNGISGLITSAKDQLDLMVAESGSNQVNGQVKPNVYNKTIVTVALTYAGYKVLDIPENLIPDDLSFGNGMMDESRFSRQEVEDIYNKEKEVHAVVMYAKNESKPKKNKDGFWTDKELKNQADLQKLKAYCIELDVEVGSLKNPFDKQLQFREGSGNPRFFPSVYLPSPKAKNNPLGVIYKSVVNPNDLPPLSMVLKNDKAGNTAFSCGSYGAFSKFEIKEKAIYLLLQDMVKKGVKDADHAVALIIGRYNDGTPLTLSKKKLGLAHNDFNYQEYIKSENTHQVVDDSTGSRCPFFSHVRKSNPRVADHLTNEDTGNVDYERKIVRRGVYYADKEQKGILFLSFQNSITKQFEYILNQWILNKESAYSPELGKSNRDLLFAKPGDVYEIPKVWNDPDSGILKVKIQESLIGFKGGFYFFVPSISFFKKINNYLNVSFGDSNNLKKRPIKIGGTDVSVMAKLTKMKK